MRGGAAEFQRRLGSYRLDVGDTTHTIGPEKFAIDAHFAI
jgi:hypothetical protein